MASSTSLSFLAGFARDLRERRIEKFTRGGINGQADNNCETLVFLGGTALGAVNLEGLPHVRGNLGLTMPRGSQAACDIEMRGSGGYLVDDTELVVVGGAVELNKAMPSTRVPGARPILAASTSRRAHLPAAGQRAGAEVARSVRHPRAITKVLAPVGTVLPGAVVKLKQDERGGFWASNQT